MQKEKSKYKSSGEWKKSDPSAYATARAKGLLDKICNHFGWNKNNHTGYWTLERCKKDALKYKTRNEWQKAKKSGYDSAKRNKWLSECCKHMEPVNREAWTLQSCKKEALKYHKKSDWKKNSSSSYERARKNNWLEECIKHMKKYENSKI